MFPCLPAPKVVTLGVHAYCLPSDCLQHHLSFGYKAAFFSSSFTPPIYSHPKYSPRGIEIASGNTNSHAVAAIMWSDDCDPQNSKKNRKALWCLTITFIQDTDVTSDTPVSTYPLAVGPKGADHQKIQKIIFDNIAEHGSKATPILSYFGQDKNILPVTLDVLAYLGDQPERRGVNYLMLGGSTHHARWRYSCNIGSLAPVLRACRECESRFLQYATSGDIDVTQLFAHCGNCTNWWISDDHPLLTYPAPKKYPSHLLLGGIERHDTDGVEDGWFRPLELTYSILTRVATMAHDNVASGAWTHKTAESFLKTNCVNEALTVSLLDKADNCLQYRLAMENNNDPETKDSYKKEKRARPKDFQMAELPPVYHSSFALEYFVDAPMHLVSLGFVKVTIHLIDKWIGARSRKSQFLKLVRPDMYHIRNMDLDWCEVVPKQFGGSYGGYISDNYLALGRLCPWLYSSVLVLEEPDPYDEPTTPIDRWVVKDCRSYLTMRGIKVPKYVAEMRQAVKLDKQNNGTSGSAILDVPTCTSQEVFECATRMHLLVAHLFTEATSPGISVSNLHVQIRLYLSAFDRLDLATRASSNSPPRWVSKYNFLCILNIPSIIEKFGPYKYLYEGKYCGEGYNRILKPTANRTSHRNRSTNLLTNLIREKSMKAVQTNFETGKMQDSSAYTPPPCTNRSLIYRMAHRYQSRNKAKLHYDRQLPLSVVIFSSDTGDVNESCYGMCYTRRNEIFVIPVEKIRGSLILVGGKVEYWQWFLCRDFQSHLPIEMIVIVSYGILLPLHGHSALECHYYTISAHLWNKGGVVRY